MQKEEGSNMEAKIDKAKKTEVNLNEEWEKPSVKEMDINAITRSGFTGVGEDNMYYS
jgi:hypothetical protein